MTCIVTICGDEDDFNDLFILQMSTGRVDPPVALGIKFYKFIFDSILSMLTHRCNLLFTMFHLLFTVHMAYFSCTSCLELKTLHINLRTCMHGVYSEHQTSDAIMSWLGSVDRAGPISCL